MNTWTRAELVAAFAWMTWMEPPAWARGISGSGLAGSPHDFTRPGNSAYQGEREANLCVFCHVGRNGSAAIGRPQWNDRLSASTITRNGSNRASDRQAPDTFDSPPVWNHELTGIHASYTMYQNGPGAPQIRAKASQAITNGMTPGSTSLLCLSCHDGSVAVNTYGNASQLSRFSAIGQDKYLGNHHPVGFDYDAVRSVDKEIRSADAAHLTATTTVRDHLYGPGNVRMECGTCHSVHNTGNSGETLLWRSDARSKLCLTCHDKGTYEAS
jgi:predicted CXXCH cytochrome family protein